MQTICRGLYLIQFVVICNADDLVGDSDGSLLVSFANGVTQNGLLNHKWRYKGRNVYFRIPHDHFVREGTMYFRKTPPVFKGRFSVDATLEMHLKKGNRMYEMKRTVV